MANANTVALDSKLPGAAQGASSTSEFQFQNNDGVAAKIVVEGKKLANRRFLLVAAGRVKGNITTNFTCRVFYGVDGTIGNNAVIGTTGAKAVNSTNGSFILECELFLDTDFLKIQGILYGEVAGTVVAQAATTAVTGVDLTPIALGTGTDKLAKQLGFTVSGQFSASDAGNYAILDEFSLEAL
jgi:hypothetical protein